MGKLLTSKLFLLYLSLLIIGFFIGYDYSVITSENYGSADNGGISAVNKVPAWEDRDVFEEPSTSQLTERLDN